LQETYLTAFNIYKSYNINDITMLTEVSQLLLRREKTIFFRISGKKITIYSTNIKISLDIC